MTLYEIREELSKGKKIFELNLKVVYYARVSTDKFDQINSLNNQINYYTKYIKDNPNWKYVNGYIDEGISGTSTKKRVSFNNMIKDAKTKKFDLIITKEISHFARDTLDSIKYTRELLSEGIGVFFQNDNLLTYDLDSELKLTIMSSIAQEEVRKLSERTKFGFQRSIENGHVLGNNNIWGYKKNNCKLIIVPHEAKIIKLIYDMYVNDRIGMRSIGNKLAKLGYFNKLGNTFSQSTIKNILTNPKYKGYYCGNKTKIVDYHSKKKIFLNSNNWKLYKDETIPAIIDEYTWNIAQSIINSKSDRITVDKRIYQNRYAFSGKIYCRTHNVTYQRHQQVSSGIKKKKIVTWRCKKFLLHNSYGCDCPTLYEDELKLLVADIILKSLANNRIVDELFEEYKLFDLENNLTKKIIKNKIEIENLTRYKETLYNLLKDDCIAIKDFKLKINDIIIQINDLENENKKIHILNNNNLLHIKELENIKKILYKKIVLEHTNKDKIIKEFIERIEVIKIEDCAYDLKIILNYNREYNISYNSNKHTFYSNYTYDKSRC